jgi:ElaA protein
VRILTAAFDDLAPRTAYDVWRLRQQVFVIEQDCPYPDLDGRDLEESTRHVVLLDDDDDGAVSGTLRVLDDGDWARIGRVVVAPAARGRGLAALMMDEAVALCGDREVRLDAQTGLTAFYARYGFEVAGPEFDEDGVMHVPMRRPAAHP